ncbi:MAG: HIRAN domain-containing protein [Opitutaceae bacterium]|nr:HIRAN domain-containing protein [Opitutaceae bacterium]
MGRLDVGLSRSDYRFRYIKGAEDARREAGFPALIDFPELREDYHSRVLFPMFQNRVLTSSRPDFGDYLRRLDLSPAEADPVEMLAVDGGFRATDSFEVFPKLERAEDGSFRCRFFLHGWRHLAATAQERIDRLVPGEKLFVTLELTNPATTLAVQLQTEDYFMIGWAPRYLVQDLLQAMVEGPGKYKAKVVRINPMPAPSKQRVLIELNGCWEKHQPMSSSEFTPLVG